jgi:hypothetical protein
MKSQAQLVSIARSWLRTPFIPRGRVKGAGADCIGVQFGIFVEAELLPPDTRLPEYRISAGDHTSHNRLVEWFERSWFFRRVEESGEIQPGDLLTIKLGRVPWHLVLVTEIHAAQIACVHAVPKHGVMESHFMLTDSRVTDHFRHVWFL